MFYVRREPIFFLSYTNATVTCNGGNKNEWGTYVGGSMKRG
jgi:hypothetical protein